MRNAFVLLSVMLLLSCEKPTTDNRVSTDVPLFNTTEEEDHFDPNYRPKDDGRDNMRGFDPASENDMDDSGMSRYQENYDEEGWD